MAKGSDLMHMADDAPEAGFAPVNFGRLTVTPMVVTFGTGDSKHDAPTRAPYKDGQKLASNQQLEFHVEVNISELNPSLQFEYTRDVRIQKSGRNKTDWTEIVLPSIVAVFGDDWGDAIMKGPYVEVEDAPNVNGIVSKKGAVLGVPKFLRVFKNKAECVKAREARFGSAAASSSGSTGDKEEGDVEIPAGVIAQVKSLISSVGEDVASTMLVGQPFGPYSVEALLAAAR